MNTKKKKKISFFDWKIWGFIAVIATVTGTVLGIIDFFRGGEPTSWSSDTIKKEINEKTTNIENVFRPNDISIDSLSTPDIQFVKDFQNATLESVICWKAMESMKPVSEFDFFSGEQLLELTMNQFSSIEQFDAEVKNVLVSVDALTRYGKSNNIKYYIPDATRIASLLNNAQKRLSITQEVRSTVIKNTLNLIIKYGNEPKGISGEEVANAFEPCEKLYNSYETLDFVNEFYSLCIILNSNYLHYLGNVKEP